MVKFVNLLQFDRKIAMRLRSTKTVLKASNEIDFNTINLKQERLKIHYPYRRWSNLGAWYEKIYDLKRSGTSAYSNDSRSTNAQHHLDVE
jgi:hypothetical protein